MRSFFAKHPARERKADAVSLQVGEPVIADRRPWIGIIGSAGRLADGPRMNAQVFHQMVDCAALILTKLGYNSTSDVRLVSGGSSFADHVCVRLFLLQNPNPGGLTVYLPAPLAADEKDPGYPGCAETWEGTSREGKDGATLNRYHHEFSRKLYGTDHDTLQELRTAQDKGAVLDASRHGFKNRNIAIAKRCSVIIAFTWGEKEPSSAGTAHTWGACQGRKIHVPLAELVADRYVW
jgi:hypothetical protein